MLKLSPTYTGAALTPFESYDDAVKGNKGFLSKLFLKMQSFVPSSRGKPLSVPGNDTAKPLKTGRSIPRNSKSLGEPDGHSSYGATWTAGTTIMEFGHEVSNGNNHGSEPRGRTSEYRHLHSFVAQFQGADSNDYSVSNDDSIKCTHHAQIRCVKCQQRFCSECSSESIQTARIKEHRKNQLCDACYSNPQARNRREELSFLARQLKQAPTFIEVNAIAGYVSPLHSPQIRIPGRPFKTTVEDFDNGALFAMNIQSEDEMDNEEGTFPYDGRQSRLLWKADSNTAEATSSSNIRESRAARNASFYFKVRHFAATGDKRPRIMKHRHSDAPIVGDYFGSPMTETRERHSTRPWHTIANLFEATSIDIAQETIPDPREPRQQKASSVDHRPCTSTSAKSDKALTSDFIRQKLRSMLRANEEVIGHDNVHLWENTLTKLLFEVMDNKDSTTTGIEEVDIHEFLKIKKLPIGSHNDSYCIKGIMCTHNVAHKRMARKILSPRILILCFPLEWSNELIREPYMRIDYPTRLQESKLLQDFVDRIAEIEPSIVLVEFSVPHDVLVDLGNAGIVVVCHMKKSALKMISQCTGADLVASASQLMINEEICLGYCGAFQVDTFINDHIPQRRKSFIIFDQCPAYLGTTVVLQGATMESLRLIKQIMIQIALTMYNYRLEIALLKDLSGTEQAHRHPQISSTQSIFGIEKYSQVMRRATEMYQNANLSVSPTISFPKPQALTRLQKASDEIVMFLKTKVPEELLDHEIPMRMDEMHTFFNIYKEDFGENQEYNRLLEQHNHCFHVLQDYLGDMEGTLLQPMDYQRLTILELLTCSAGVRHDAEVYTFKYYRCKFDLTLGEYIEHVVSDVEGPCPSSQCDHKMLDHGWSYVHGSGRVDVDIQPITGDTEELETGAISVWSHCKHRNSNSPSAQLSESGWKYSFGKFLELLFYQTENMTTHDQESHWCCSHGLLRDHDHYFYIKGVVVRFQYQPIQPFEIRVPLSQLRSGQGTYDTVKEDTRETIESEVLDFYSSILEHHRNFSLDSVHLDSASLYQEFLHQMSIYASSERKETLESLKAVYERASSTNIRLLSAIRTWLQIKAKKWRMLHNDFMECFGRSNITPNHPITIPSARHLSMLSPEEITSQRTSVAMTTPDFSVALDGELDDIPTLSTDVMISCRPELGESPTGTKPSSLYLENDSLALQQHSIGDNVNPGILSEVTGLSNCATWLSEVMTSFTTVLGKPDTKGNQNDNYERFYFEEVTHSSFSAASIDNYDVLCRREEELSFSNQQICYEVTPLSVHADPVDESHLSSNENVPITSTFWNTCLSMDRNASEAVWQTYTKDRLHGVSKYIEKNIGYGFSMLDYPLSSTEHLFRDSPIIIDEDEPSTIAAYTLDSKEYHAQLEASLQMNGLYHESHITDEEKVNDFIYKTLHDANDEPFKKAFQDDRSKFSCEIYFLSQFDALRRKCGYEASYIHSLASASKSTSLTGKPGAEYHKTKDNRLMIKMISRNEMNEFLKLAPEYFKYLADALFNEKHTILMKILGSYRIKYYSSVTGKSAEIDIVVMENPFNGHSVNRTFNLKGSSRNRYVETTATEDVVLLDENLRNYVMESSPLYLHPHSKLLLKSSINNDTCFLSQMRVTNYSLLVGVNEETRDLVVAITDYYRTYTFERKVEYYAKEAVSIISGDGREPTILPSQAYCDRFRHEMDQYFLMVPDFWTNLDALSS